MRRFVLDVLAHYANASACASSEAVQHVRFERLDHQRLRMRGCLKHLTDSPPLLRLTAWEKLRNNYYFFFQPPAPLLGARRQRLRTQLTPSRTGAFKNPEPGRIASDLSRSQGARSRLERVGFGHSVSSVQSLASPTWF